MLEDKELAETIVQDVLSTLSTNGFLSNRWLETASATKVLIFDHMITDAAFVIEKNRIKNEPKRLK